VKFLGIKSLIKSSIRTLGYDIHKVVVGRDPFYDMQQLTKLQPCLVVFDVGANVGQTIDLFRGAIIQPIIHAFEPSQQTFRALHDKYSAIPDLYLNNFALGAEPGVLEFIENTHPTMSSFLEPGAASWGEIKQRVQVNVKTVDDYCADLGVDAIDILKLDTQGFDLKVIEGSNRLLAQHRIHLIYMEIIFSEMYKGLPRFDEIFGFLADRGFVLVTFYEFHYQNGRLGWTDALFVDPQFRSLSRQIRIDNQ
jgi:FkbM family methyltransferase